MRQKVLSNRSFGIEFEIGSEIPQELIGKYIESASILPVHVTEKWDESIENNYWHVKYDSSCGVAGHGWEIASFKASGWNELHHIAQTANGFEYLGCKVNDNCGLHIHVDASDFTPAQMGVLLGRWLKIEPMLCKLVPFRRVNNKHCRLICKSRKVALSKKHTGEFIWEALKPTAFNPHENRQKKVTLNTVNYAGGIHSEGLGTTFRKPKTIEFRLPEGTLNYSSVVSWAVFFLNFIESAKMASTPDNLLGVKSIRKFFQFAGLGASNDCQLDDVLLTTKLWLLKRFYMFGSDDLKNQIGRLQFN